MRRGWTRWERFGADLVNVVHAAWVAGVRAPLNELVLGKISSARSRWLVVAVPGSEPAIRLLDDHFDQHAVVGVVWHHRWVLLSFLDSPASERSPPLSWRATSVLSRQRRVVNC